MALDFKLLKDVREVKSDFTVAVERGRQETTPQPGDAGGTPPSLWAG